MYGVASSQAWAQIESNPDFMSLERIDKTFIFGFMCEVNHNRGGKYLSDSISTAESLISIAKNKSNYGISNLYESMKGAGLEVWNESTHFYTGCGIGGDRTYQYKSIFDSKYGTDFLTNNKNANRRAQEYAYISALCAGYECYNYMMELIIADSPTVNNGGAVGTAQEQFLSMAKTVWDVWYVEIPAVKGDGKWYFQSHVNTATYGTIRADCSGYVSTIIWQLGYIDNPLGKTTAYYYSNSLGLEEVSGGLSSMQPGDIVVWRSSPAHVQIYAGTDDAGNRLWYSWGSNKGIRAGGPSTSGETNLSKHNDIKVFRLNR